MNYGKLETQLFKSKENYLKAWNRDQEKRTLIETVYNSIGYSLAEGINNGLIKIDGNSQTLKEINELLNDIKEINQWK